MSDTCSRCKHADRHKRYCHIWQYLRCETYDFCYLFKQDDKLDIIIRKIWWFNPVKSMTRGDTRHDMYLGLKEGRLCSNTMKTQENKP